MAVDEAIMQLIAQQASPPTLRFYAWDPPCCSLGYAQAVGEIDLLRLGKLGWQIVRRPTGGRAILHTDELTYSVIAPETEPRLSGGLLESYQILSQAFLKALINMGINATVQTSHRMRHNRFVETFGEHRLKELLCIGSYSPMDDLPPLKVAFQDLFRFWWNRCIEPELFLDEILRDIFDYFTDEMKPAADAPQQMKISLNFDQLDLFGEKSEKAA